MKSWPRIALGLLVVVLTALGCATQGPPGTGWVTLLDGSPASLNNWNRAGDAANWRSEDGLVVADKGGKASGQLVTKGVLQGFPDLGRVLGRRDYEQRDFPPYQRSEEHHLQERV